MVVGPMARMRVFEFSWISHISSLLLLRYVLIGIFPNREDTKPHGFIGVQRGPITDLT